MLLIDPYRFISSLFPAYSSEQRYNANPQGANDQAGKSVAVSGDGLTMVIGAPYDDDEFSDGGRAFVFIRGVGNSWTQQAVVKPTSGGGAGQLFGWSVGLSDDGDTLIVGGPGSVAGVQGHAFVFTRSAGIWTQHTDLNTVATGEGATDMFGAGVAINSAGNTCAVGAPTIGAFDRGAVWCFALSAGVWGEQAANMVHSSPANTDYMGQGLALSDDGNILVASTRKKKAEVFKRTGSTWAWMAELAPASPPGGTDPSVFDITIAVSADGKRVLLPCPTANVGATNDGCMYEFTESGGVWSEGQQLTSATPSNGEWFGYKSCMNAAGNRCVIGGTVAFGEVEVWDRTGSVWTRRQIIVPTGDSDAFGPCSISSDGLVLAVGAPEADDPGPVNADGAVYTYM